MIRDNVQQRQKYPPGPCGSEAVLDQFVALRGVIRGAGGASARTEASGDGETI